MKFHKLDNSRLSTESRTPPHEIAEQDASKLNITEESQLKHSGSATERITDYIQRICHDIFLSENKSLDISLFYLGKSQKKTEINLLKSLELVVYKTLYGHTWATIERANFFKFEECKSYPYTVDDIGIKIKTLQSYHRDWKKSGYLEKLHDAVRSHPEFSELKEFKKQQLENFHKQLDLLEQVNSSSSDEKVKLWLLKNDDLVDSKHNINNVVKIDVDTIEDLSDLTSSESSDLYNSDNLDDDKIRETSLEFDKQWDENIKNNCELIDIQCDFIRRGNSFLNNYSKIEYLTKNNAYLKECGMLRGDSDFEIARSINFMHYYLKLLQNLHDQGHDTLAYSYWTTEKRKDLKFDSIITSEEINMKNVNEVKTEYKWLDALARLIDLKVNDGVPCVATALVGDSLIIGLNSDSDYQRVKSEVDKIKNYFDKDPKEKLMDHFNLKSNANLEKILAIKKYLDELEENITKGKSLNSKKPNEGFEDLFNNEDFIENVQSNIYKTSDLKTQVNNYLKSHQKLFDSFLSTQKSFDKKGTKSGSQKSDNTISLDKLDSNKLQNATHNQDKIVKDIDILVEYIHNLKNIKIIYSIDGKEIDDSFQASTPEQIMHAEISIIEYIKKNPELIEKLLKSDEKMPYVYIGNNKKACPACHASMEFFNEDQTNPFTVVYRGHHHDFDGLIQLDSSNYDNKIIEISNQEIFKQKLDQLNQYQYASFVANGRENKTLLEKMYKIFTETHDKKNIKDEHNPTPAHSVADGELRDEIKPNAFNKKYDDSYRYSEEDVAIISNQLFTQKKLVELQDENIKWKGVINKDELEVIEDGETIVGVAKVNEHYVVLAIHRSGEDYKILCRDAVSNEWENYKNSDNFEITINDKKIHISKENLTFSLAKNNNDFNNSAIYALNDAVKMVEYVSDNRGNFNQESFDKIKFTGKTSADEKKTTEHLQSIYDAFLNFEKIINQDSSEILADLDPIYQEFKQKTMVNLVYTLKNKFSKVSHETLLHSKIHNEINAIRQNFADIYFKYHVEQMEKENVIDINQLKENLNQAKQDIKKQKELDIDLKGNIINAMYKITAFLENEETNVDTDKLDWVNKIDNAKTSKIKSSRLDELIKAFEEFLDEFSIKIQGTTLFLKPSEEVIAQVKAKLGNPQVFRQDVVSPENNAFEEHDNLGLLKKAKPVQGFYSNDDVNLLIESLLKEKELSRNNLSYEVTGDSITLKTYIFDARSLNTEQITVNEADYLNSLKQDIDKILSINKNTDLQILIPIRLKTMLHWATAQLKVNQDQKIKVLIYDSAYENTLVNSDIIFELNKLYNINQITSVKHAKVTKIQVNTEEKCLKDVYCGGYTAHLISNLTVTPDVDESNNSFIWGVNKNSDEQRHIDANLVDQKLPEKALNFGKSGDNLDSKKKSQEKDLLREESTKYKFYELKNALSEYGKIRLPEELINFIAAIQKENIFKTSENFIDKPDEFLNLIREIPKEIENKLGFLKQGETSEDKDRVFSNIEPEQVLYILKALYDENDVYGVVHIAGKGLTFDSINLNLDSIIKSYDQTDLYINSKIIDEQQVLNNILNWSVNKNTFGQYATIVKIENNAGKKHAILLHAKQEDNTIEITLIDPLSQENSEFIVQLNTLKTTLSNQISHQVQIVYEGCQDKDYGTCGDMCLIMLQELIEQTANIPTIGNNFLDTNQINHGDNIFHNFDYENTQTDILGNCHDS